MVNGLSRHSAVFLFRGFYFWLTGVNLILEELRDANKTLNQIKEMQTKDYEINRRIYALTEVNANNLQNIENNVEQLLIIWE